MPERPASPRSPQTCYLVAELLVHAALARQESVGAHVRGDHPAGTPPAGDLPGTPTSGPTPPPAPPRTQPTSLAERESETV